MQVTMPQIESYGISDIGLTRQDNEDVWAELPQWNLYVLADGMGGHQAGEVAAKEAVMHLCDSIDTFFSLTKKPTLDQVIRSLGQAFHDVNDWVRSLAKEHPELSGMGTTLCCFVLIQETLVCAHLGDSRIYQFRAGKLERLTRDHSLRQELIAKGDLDEKTASAFPFKNVITKAIGTFSEADPDIETVSVKKNDIFFLCSDGLTDFLSDSEIEAILQKKASIKNKCIELVEGAKAAGGSDNITIVMIKI